MQTVTAACKSNPTHGVSSKGDAEPGHIRKLGRTQPGSAIHQGLKAIFCEKMHLN